MYNMILIKIKANIYRRPLTGFGKFRGYGNTGQLFDLMKSFLSNREMEVVLSRMSSISFRMNADVPQGSIISAALFSIFINDLRIVIGSQVGIYAVDTIMYSCPNSKSGIAAKLTWPLV